jgi:hypothetical protein
MSVKPSVSFTLPAARRLRGLASMALFCGLVLALPVPAAAQAGWPQAGGSTGDDSAQAVRLDKDGNVYATGYFRGTASFGPFTLTSAGGTDIYVVKLSRLGDWLWAVRAGGPLDDQGAAIAVDKDSNAYVAGTVRGTAFFGASINDTATDVDPFVAKLDKDGTWRWAKLGKGNGVGEGRGVAATSAAVYVTGHFNNALQFAGGTTLQTVNPSAVLESHPTNTDAFVVKLDKDGAHQWSYRAGGILNDVETTTASCLSSGWCCGHPLLQNYISFFGVNISWCGLFGVSEAQCQNWLGSPDATATALYGRPVCLTSTLHAHSADSGTAIAVSYQEPLGGLIAPPPLVYVTGSFEGTFRAGGLGQLSASGTRNKDAFVAKLRDDGTSAAWIWSMDAGSTTASDVVVSNAVVVDNSSNLYLAGSYSGTPQFGTAAVTASPTRTRAWAAKLADGGGSAGWAWAQSAGSTLGDAQAFGVAVDEQAGTAQGVYVSGVFAKEIQFASSPSPIVVAGLEPNHSSRDIFVARLAASPATVPPNWNWGNRGGYLFDDAPDASKPFDKAAAIAADPGGTTFLAATFQGGGRFVEGPKASFDGLTNAAQGLLDVSETDYAASLWFKTSSPNGGLYSVVNEDGSANDRHIYLSGGKLCARVWNDERICTLSSGWADGKWHNVVHTFGGGLSQRLYVDGVQQTIQGLWNGYYSYVSTQGFRWNSNFNWQTHVQIGRSTDASPPFFTGEIQNVVIEDSFVSLATAISRYNAYKPTAETARPGALLFGANRHAVLASLTPAGKWREFERWVVGDAVPMPEGVQPLHPDVELAVGILSDYFLWSDAEKKLYALRPGAALVKWKLTSNPQDFNRVVSVGAAQFVRSRAVAHVATAPVDVQPPLLASNPFTFVKRNYATNDAAVTDPPADGPPSPGAPPKLFNATTTGYSVLVYARGTAPDTAQNPVYVEVVYTDTFDKTTLADGSPNFPDGNVTPAAPEVSCRVGTAIGDPTRHLDPSGKNGFVVNPAAPYDAFGVVADGAHDRSKRRGPIIPVNKTGRVTGDDMVLAWYKLADAADTNRVPVAWASNPVRYNCQWPATPPQIVIASEKGSDRPGQPPLDPLVFTEMRIYDQPVEGLAGFNPNDEHALFAPSNAGTGFQGLFALRNDLGVKSDPYALLKYRDGDTLEWSIKVYQVVSGGLGAFNYPGTAGTRVFAPYPVSQLENCQETNGSGAPFFRDHKGAVWARSGPVAVDPGAHIMKSRFFYPLQPGFYWPRGGKAPGDCVAWLDGISGPGGTPSLNTPIEVTYAIQWPTDAPILTVGETLLKAKKGLPEIYNQAASEVVFDELGSSRVKPTGVGVTSGLGPDPLRVDPARGLVQLIQPIFERSVPLAALPADIRTEPEEARFRLADLPFHLKVRTLYDPANQKLIFRGHFDDSEAGDPLLLLNIMTLRDKAGLEKLSSNGSYRDAVKALYDLTRNPRKLDLAPQNAQPDPALYPGLTDNNNDGSPEPLRLLGSGGALTAGAAVGVGYVTLAFNNDPSLGAAPVSLNVIRVDCAQPASIAPPVVANGTYQGQIKVIKPDNVFDEKLTLRHSGDFGGRADELTFEWWTHPDEDGLPPTPLPGQPGSTWTAFTPSGFVPLGAVEITIEGADRRTLSDNWFLVRYKGYNDAGAGGADVCQNKNAFGPFAGSPGGTRLNPRAQLGEGWIKRVTRGLNPFEARVKDFHQAQTNTFASMMVQIGERYEGDIALNSSASNLNSIGLISAYETVLRRGMKLSVGGTPPVDYAPVNNALLNVASRIADFYSLLGNEAYADAVDPTIGFSTDSEIGNMAPAIFSFQNQLDSLLEEELVLLRGRDDKRAPTTASPVYNRLFWNFTSGEGEIAYSQNYNISDQNFDGLINSKDSRILFPQGHGDAWGHYLTASTTYYSLLRHPFFTWQPRPEAVTVAGVPIQVDYLDERKFATIASAKARAGAEIVDLTYRQSYVEDPAGQWQGYKDSNADRGWGLSEWARRAGQGAYFDWVVANAILPSSDPNPDHTGIQKIDRTTVSEIAEIVGHYQDVQGKLDQADKGLNPLGLAKGVVPFDIDPSVMEVSGGEASSHFDQVYARALKSLNGAVSVFDHANAIGQRLRETQDTVDQFAVTANDQERNFRNRLIEIFGYPYDDDIGGGKIYPDGYNGPDLYHYMYVDSTDLTGDSAPAKTEESTFTGYYGPLTPELGHFPGDTAKNAVKAIPYVTARDSRGMFIRPSNFQGRRRALGELQRDISNFIQARSKYQQTKLQYDNLLKQIEDKASSIKEKYNLDSDKIELKRKQRNATIAFNVILTGLKTTQKGIETAADTMDGIGNATITSIPTSFIAGLAAGGDIASAARGAIKGIAVAAKTVARVAITGLELGINSFETAKEITGLQTEIELDEKDRAFAVQQAIKELEAQVRQEPVVRLDLYNQKEAVDQTIEKYRTTLANGQRVLEDLIVFRKNAAADVQDYRYRDMAFRIFRNDALQKYRAQFDMAARYAYLAATAYDYETNMLGSSGAAGRRFLTDIVKQRSLGQVVDGEPIAGTRGLADVLARMSANWDVLKPQLGINNPQFEVNAFSLRSELFRQQDADPNSTSDDSDVAWRDNLEGFRVADLWKVPEFRRYCRPFAPESFGPQPGLVIPFSTTVTFGLNFFGFPLGGGDNSYDPSQFATKVRAVGLWFGGYNATGLSNTPRVYLVPAGADILRSPAPGDFKTREWQVIDQALPVPFPIGESDLGDPDYIPINDGLNEPIARIRRAGALRAHHLDGIFDDKEMISETRLIGRSVWNTRWLLIIPGGTLLNNPTEGLDTFIRGALVPGGAGARDGAGITDIQMFFRTYAFSGQ